MGSLTLRIDDDVHQLLRALALVKRTSANQIIGDLIRAEVDRALPGRLAHLRNTTPEQREAAMLAAIGIPAAPILAAEDQAAFSADLDAAERQARETYGDAEAA